MFDCLYLIQIHISEPIGTKLGTRLPLGLKETVGYVWVRNSLPLRTFGPFFFSGHKMAAGATVFRDILSVVPAGVRVTSPTYIVADGGVIRGSLISVILAGVPLTSRKLHSSRRQSHPPRCCIPYSRGGSCHATDITLYRAAGPSATALYSSFYLLFCGLQEITSLRTTLARAQSNCVALSEIRTVHWDVNGIHVSTIRNLIRRE
jgi:hypothetical protein